MDSTVEINDLKFKKFIDKNEIQEANHKIAEKLNRELEGKTNVIAVALMNGAFMFTADLTRLINQPLDIYCIKANSYNKTKSTGKLNYKQPIEEIQKIVKGKRVILLDDIADTGLTLTTVSKDFKEMGAISVYPIAMFYKKEIYSKGNNVELFSYGITIGSEFVVGYGLDYDNIGRNLPNLYKLTE